MEIKSTKGEKVSTVLSGIKLFVEYLEKRGHPKRTIKLYKNAVLLFYQWLKKMNLQDADINTNDLSNYVYRYLSNYEPFTHFGNRNIASAALHKYFFIIRGIKKYELKEKQSNPSIESELTEFLSYLKTICGLSDNTCIYRIRNVRNFLYYSFGQKPFVVEHIKKINYHKYISENTTNCTTGTKNVIASSLRSYLKYLQFKGIVDADYARIVPSIPNWKLSNIADIFSIEQISKLLNSFDRTKPAGQRDYAMALCMIDLGLRASEVAGIELQDIDWRQSILQIRKTKSHRDRNLPLPRRVGEAIVHYLCNGRLDTNAKKLFIRHTVPFGISLNVEQVRGAMRRAYKRSGFSESITGTHILRHTAASRMHQNGATIKELADVLGHKSINTTIFYTKINLPYLRKVSLPWPEAKR